LRELRQDLELTQQQAAQAADMTQSELSRLEGRADYRDSTLRRYVEALGGKLEITVAVSCQLSNDRCVSCIRSMPRALGAL
jgi:predicted transcriptional regulator